MGKSTNRDKRHFEKKSFIPNFGSIKIMVDEIGFDLQIHE